MPYGGRLSPLDPGSVDHLETRDTVGSGAVLEVAKKRYLGPRSGDPQLAALDVGKTGCLGVLAEPAGQPVVASFAEAESDAVKASKPARTGVFRNPVCQLVFSKAAFSSAIRPHGSPDGRTPVWSGLWSVRGV